MLFPQNLTSRPEISPGPPEAALLRHTVILGSSTLYNTHLLGTGRSRAKLLKHVASFPAIQGALVLSLSYTLGNQDSQRWSNLFKSWNHIETKPVLNLVCTLKHLIHFPETPLATGPSSRHSCRGLSCPGPACWATRSFLQSSSMESILPSIWVLDNPQATLHPKSYTRVAAFRRCHLS